MAQAHHTGDSGPVLECLCRAAHSLLTFSRGGGITSPRVTGIRRKRADVIIFPPFWEHLQGRYQEEQSGETEGWKGRRWFRVHLDRVMPERPPLQPLSYSIYS